MGEDIESAQQHLGKAEEILIEISEIGKEKEDLLYNQNGLEITESDIQKIVNEYFSGGNLENVKFK